MDLDELFKQAQRLDPQALGQLHDLFYPVVYKYVSFRLQDQQICEDISSEVFVRLLDTFHRRDRMIKDVRAWMIGIASNIIPLRALLTSH